QRPAGSSICTAAMNSSRSFTARPFPAYLPPSMRNRGPASARNPEKTGPRGRTGSVPFAPELLEEPGPGIGPQQVGRARRDAQDLRRLLAGQAAEKAKLDQFRRPGVRAGQLAQQVIELEDVEGRFAPDNECLVQADAGALTAVLDAAFAAGVVDEDAA